MSKVSKIILALFFSILFYSCGDKVKVKEFISPDEQYAELFDDVQSSAVFPDSKTFVDCIPHEEPEEILKKYRLEKTRSDFNLQSFVLANFDLPGIHDSGYKSDTTLDAAEHINSLWPVLTRNPTEETEGTLITLRNPYVVPGGRFGEVYYWDSYFTMLGLEVSGETQMIENMVTNFAQLIQDFGHIPNGNRSYYLSRSQPPFFSFMVELLAEAKKDDQILVKYLPQMQKEYQYWMSSANREEGNLQTEKRKSGEKAFKKVVFIDSDNLLNRYCDESNKPRPEAYKEDVETARISGRDISVVYNHLRSGAESGWDFSSRWLKENQQLSTIHTTEILPVDLNALLYHLEEVLGKAYKLSGKPDYAESYEKLKAKRQAIFDRFFWNTESGFYYDYDFIAGEQKEIKSLAAVYPLFCKIASQKQAEQVAEILQAEFLKPGGLPATLEQTGQQWDAPNGWAPLQWMAIAGLRNYGLNDLADQIKKNWVNNNLRVYKNTGKMVEKYNVNDITLLAGGGEYPVQDGFGWTNGVLLKLLSE